MAEPKPQSSPEFRAFVERMREHHKRLYGNNGTQVANSGPDRQVTASAVTQPVGSAPAEYTESKTEAGRPPRAANEPMEPNVGEDTDETGPEHNVHAPPKSTLVTLTSETDEPDPAPRSRLKIGLGELVVLKVSGGNGTWSCSGGKLSKTEGTTVILYAPERPATIEVTVVVGGTKASLSFTVVAPSSIAMTLNNGFHADNRKPNAGMILQPYLGPADVNFSNVGAIELEAVVSATGSWAEFNGRGHNPNNRPMVPLSTVTAGKGTQLGATDRAQSGWIDSDIPLADWSGTLAIDIPWHWKCGKQEGFIANVTLQVVTDDAGSTTISKGGASYTAALS